jgi:hypothetical protein
MENITINNCNIPSILERKGTYRLGDMVMVYDTTNFSEHYLINNKNFEGTVLNRFAKKVTSTDLGVKKRALLCAKVVKEMVSEKEYPNAGDSLVIHLRLGDVFGIIDDHPSSHKRPNLDKILKAIQVNKCRKIIIVTAYAFGKGGYSTPDIVERGIKESKNFLETIIKHIPPGVEHEIKSSENPDDDFIFLVTAKNLLITGGSCFSKAAKFTNTCYKKL